MLIPRLKPTMGEIRTGEVLKSMLDSEEGSLNIGVHVVVEELLIDIGEDLATHDTSVQDNDIEATPFRDSSIDKTFTTLDGSSVSLEGDGVTLPTSFDGVDNLFSSTCIINVVDDNVGTLSTQCLGNSSTDGARRAGNNSDLSYSE
jgi:hypothetical protein